MWYVICCHLHFQRSHVVKKPASQKALIYINSCLSFKRFSRINGYQHFNPFNAGIAYIYVTIWRIKTVPALEESKYIHRYSSEAERARWNIYDDFKIKKNLWFPLFIHIYYSALRFKCRATHFVFIWRKVHGIYYTMQVIASNRWKVPLGVRLKSRPAEWKIPLKICYTFTIYKLWNQTNAVETFILFWYISTFVSETLLGTRRWINIIFIQLVLWILCYIANVMQWHINLIVDLSMWIKYLSIHPLMLLLFFQFQLTAIWSRWTRK